MIAEPSAKVRQSQYSMPIHSPKVAEMCHGAAEGREAKHEKNAEHITW